MLRKKMLCIISISLLIIFTGCNGEKEVFNDKDFKYVEVTSVEKKNISREMDYSGRVKAEKEVNIMGKTTGEVEVVNFNVGDMVKKGDVLYVMDKKALENNIESIKSQIESTEALVASAQSGYNMSKGSQKKQSLNQSEAALEQAEIQYNEAKKNYEDIQALFEKNAVSKQQLDQIKASYEQAKVAYETVEKSHELLLNEILDENISLAKNQLDQASASKKNLLVQLKNANDTFDDLEVKSPIDGIVSAENVEVGELLGAGTPAFTIVNINKVYLDIGVSEKVINKIILGQKIDVFVDAVENKPFEGVVIQKSPAADAKTLTYPVRIEIENSNGTIKPGMYAEAAVLLGNKENALIVPRNALRISGDQWSAYIVSDEMVKTVEVEIGIDNGKEVEIIGGLEEGQLVITNGREYVKDGDLVKVKKL